MSWGPGQVPALHRDRNREKVVTSEGLFKNWITLEQTGPEGHRPYSPPSSQMAAAQLLHQMICFLNYSPTPTSPLSLTLPFLFSTHAFLFSNVLSLCQSESLLGPWIAVWADGAVSKCLLMCRLHMMLDLVVRGHNLLVFRCGRSEAHILIHAGGSR